MHRHQKPHRRLSSPRKPRKGNGKAHHEDTLEAAPTPEPLHTDQAAPSNNEELPPPIGEPMTAPKLSRFRLSVSHALATEPETTTTIIIMRPPRDFIRVHPDPDYSLTTRVLETKREFYLSIRPYTRC
jgi:hypothetical protein